MLLYCSSTRWKTRPSDHWAFHPRGYPCPSKTMTPLIPKMIVVIGPCRAQYMFYVSHLWLEGIVATDDGSFMFRALNFPKIGVCCVVVTKSKCRQHTFGFSTCEKKDDNESWVVIANWIAFGYISGICSQTKTYSLADFKGFFCLRYPHNVPKKDTQKKNVGQISK